MAFEEIKARCETLKMEVFTWKKELDDVNEWDLKEVNAVLDSLHKLILEALADNQLNELLNFPLACCESFIRSVKRHDMPYSFLSESLNSLMMVIESTIKKEQKEDEIRKFRMMFMDCAEKEERKDVKEVLFACADHADKIFDVIY